MSITPDEAARALESADQARNRVGVFAAYRRGARSLLLWGPIWFLMYFAAHFFPAKAGLIIAIGAVIGIFGSVLLLWLTRTRPEMNQDARRRSLALLGAIFVFIFAENAILGPMTTAQSAAIPALTIGIIYVVIGIMFAARYLVVGLALIIGAAVGYFLLRDFYLIWLGVVGGGALMLTGLWLRKA